MKKILIALALVATTLSAGAQVKPADARKALDAAVLASQNEKKAIKADTWTKLGDAYIAAHDAPAGSLWYGASKQELSMVLKETPSATEQVTLNGEAFLKEVYADKVLYFNAQGQLAIIEVTSVVEPDALEKAQAAYTKAYSIDPKKTGAAVKAALENLNKKFTDDAYTYYQTGDYAKALPLFEKAAEAKNTEPLSQIDTSCLYNAGFIAAQIQDTVKAKALFEACYKAGYYAADGEVYSRLADLDAANAKAYLEEGFTKFPQSQSILIGLINYYIKANDDPEKLFELLDKAKVNEPNNASLYYVEGNIRNQLGQSEAAIEAYRKCATINPSYEYGYIGEGILHYNQAIEIQTKAQEEVDDAKYAALVKDFEVALKACIEPFEKAFEVTADAQIKTSVAEYLKNACFRFRDQDPKYQADYEKYAAYK